MCVDLATCGISLLIASAVSYRPIWSTDVVLLRAPLRSIILTGGLGLCWHLCLVATDVYKSFRMQGLGAQVTALARGATLVSICSWIWLCVVRGNILIAPTSFLLEVLAFWCLTFASFVITRLLARAWTIALRRHGRNLRNVLILGSNQRAVALATRLEADLNLGYRVSGFVDDSWHDEAAPEQYRGLLLGTSDNMLELLRIHAIDEVIVALPIASWYAYTERVIGWCLQQGIPIRSEGSLFDLRRQKKTFRAIGSPRLITLYEAPQSEWDVTCKRLLDVIASGLLLLITAPIMAVVALLIKVSSEGPVLFKQERLGLNKRRFHILKFRTMVTHAEALLKDVEHLNESAGPTFKLAKDPRITPIGAFLRKSSLDELPQLWNVFLGHMSLVGPRPLPLRDYDGFSADWHRRRFSVKPGVTCLWQISGRSSITFERWMELDMTYIDEWSFWLDIEILLRTVPAVFKGSGAV